MVHFLFVAVNDINATGVRTLSALLKSAGHQASIVFFKRPGYPYTDRDRKYVRAARKIEPGDWVGIERDGTLFRYARGPAVTPNERDLLLSLVQRIDPDVIGFTVTAPLLKRIGALAGFLKRHVSVPIVFGGAGATIDPESCLESCDYACVGEAEHTVLQIADALERGDDLSGVKNLCYSAGGRVVRNDLNPLLIELLAKGFDHHGCTGRIPVHADTLRIDLNRPSLIGGHGAGIQKLHNPIDDHTCIVNH